MNTALEKNDDTLRLATKAIEKYKSQTKKAMNKRLIFQKEFTPLNHIDYSAHTDHSDHLTQG